jgi:hypothetical protein
VRGLDDWIQREDEPDRYTRKEDEECPDCGEYLENCSCLDDPPEDEELDDEDEEVVDPAPLPRGDTGDDDDEPIPF